MYLALFVLRVLPFLTGLSSLTPVLLKCRLLQLVIINSSITQVSNFCEWNLRLPCDSRLSDNQAFSLPFLGYFPHTGNFGPQKPYFQGGAGGRICATSGTCSSRLGI